jgi:hypothetical protein
VAALRQVGGPVLGVVLDRVRPAPAATLAAYQVTPTEAAAHPAGEPGVGPSGRPAVAAKPDE